MRIFHPTFTDRRGQKCTSRKPYLDFVDHRQVRHRIPCEGCRDDQDAAKFAQCVEQLVIDASHSEKPDTRMDTWLRSLPLKTRRFFVNLHLIDNRYLATALRARRKRRSFNSTKPTTARQRRAFGWLADRALVEDGRPPALSSVVGLQHIPFVPRLIYPPAVYFLLDNGALVYIGSTTDLAARLVQHAHEKRFDAVAWIPVDGGEKELQAVEHAFQQYFGLPRTGRSPHLRTI